MPSSLLWGSPMSLQHELGTVLGPGVWTPTPALFLGCSREETQQSLGDAGGRCTGVQWECWGGSQLTWTICR